ncbi:MAG: hypothetical protein AAGA56_04795 [Myxococcota bacterium]
MRAPDGNTAHEENGVFSKRTSPMPATASVVVGVSGDVGGGAATSRLEQAPESTKMAA